MKHSEAKKIRVAVTYRVCQHWRAHIFAKLNSIPEFEVTVFHGQTVPKTKLVNGRDLKGFKNIEHFTISFSGCPWVFQPFIWVSLIRHKPTVILAEGGSNFFTNMLVFLYAILFRCPIIWWTLGELPGEAPKGTIRSIFRKLVRLQEKFSTVFLGYSSHAMNYFRIMRYPEENCFVAVNCVDTHRVFRSIESNQSKIAPLREEYQLTDKKVILFVGAFTPQKGLSRLLRAFSEISKQHQDSVLLLVGDGVSMESLVEEAGRLGLSDRVIFSGNVVDDVSNYFELGDVFVLPGLGGLAISEAMAHRLPVVCTFADGCEVDYIIEGETGFRIPSVDDKEVEEFLVNKIGLLLEDDDYRKRLGANAFKLIKDKYNVDTYVKGISNAITYASQLRSSN